MRKMVLVMCALFSAAPVLAQDGSEAVTQRTPESAQRFLQMATPIALGLYRNDGTTVAGYWTISSVSSPDACTTILNVDENVAIHRPFASVQIDWHKMRGTKQVVDAYSGMSAVDVYLDQTLTIPDTVGDNVNHSTNILRLMFGDKLDRAVVAMNYLKTACDKSVETGF